jgi:hypothetical protein
LTRFRLSLQALKENSWINHPGRLTRAAIFIFLGVFIFVLFLTAGLARPYNSDHASIMLEAKAIIDEQNILLKGWNLSTVSYLTTEIPAYVIGILLFGFTEKVIFIVTALNYTLLTLAVVYICSFSSDGKFSTGRLMISTCLSFFLLQVFSVYKLFSPVHIVAFTYCILSLLCIRNFGKNNILNGFIFGLLLILAFVGDEFAIYAWGVPIALALFYQSFWGAQKKWSRVFLAITVLSIFLSNVTLNLLTQNGGFIIPGVNSEMKFVSLENLSRNFNLFIVGVLDLFGMNFFGKPILDVETGKMAIHFLGLAVFILSIYHLSRNFRRQNVIAQIALLAVVLNLFEYLFSNIAVDINTVRYLVPALIGGMILMTEIITSHHWYIQKPTLVSVVCCIVAISLLPPLSTSRPALSIDPLSAFLAEHDLKNGYSSFWTAAVTTIHSHGDVTLRQVKSYDGQTVQPQYWLSEDGWYREKANFLVIDNSNPYSLSTAIAVNTFGKPSNEYEVDQFTILVWNKDISTLLKIPVGR